MSHADAAALAVAWSTIKARRGVTVTYASGSDSVSLAAVFTQPEADQVDGEEIDLWSARDTLVLKALATDLARHLSVSRSCTHVEDHGGAKAAVRQVM